MPSATALGLLDVFAREGDRWQDLHDRRRLRHQLRGGHRRLEEEVTFEAALAELTRAGALVAEPAYRFCRHCGGRWTEGPDLNPQTPEEESCPEHELEIEQDHTIDLPALQTLIAEEIAQRWGAAELIWVQDHDDVRLTGTLRGSTFGIVWFPTRHPDPDRDTFAARSTTRLEGWALPDIYWVDLLRSPLTELITARIIGSVRQVTLPVGTIDAHEAALLAALIRSFLRRVAAPISESADLAPALAAEYPARGLACWSVGTARICTWTADQSPLPGSVLVLARGTTRDRIRATTATNTLREQVDSWLDRRARLSPLFVLFGSTKALLGIVGTSIFSAVSGGLTVITGSDGPWPWLQALGLLIAVILVLGLVLYTVYVAVSLRRPFPPPGGDEANPPTGA